MGRHMHLPDSLLNTCAAYGLSESVPYATINAEEIRLALEQRRRYSTFTRCIKMGRLSPSPPRPSIWEIFAGSGLGGVGKIMCIVLFEL